MHPEVRFEVGRLAVHLPAAGERTTVSLLGRLLLSHRLRRRRRRRRRLLAARLFGRSRAPAVPGVQPATPLLRAGVAARETRAVRGADRARAAFVQVQQDHGHHQ